MSIFEKYTFDYCKERVLSLYPNAFIEKNNINQWTCYSDLSKTNPLCKPTTKMAVWFDAMDYDEMHDTIWIYLSKVLRWRSYRLLCEYVEKDISPSSDLESFNFENFNVREFKRIRNVGTTCVMDVRKALDKKNIAYKIK